MPVSAGTKTSFTFVKGLMTEASPLSYPENTAQVVDNFLLNRTGSIQRRLGMEYENGYLLKDSGSTNVSLDTAAVGFDIWYGINNKSTLRFGVVQVGNKLWFVDMFHDDLSANFKNGGSAFTLEGSGDDLVDLTSINGYLVVCGVGFQPFYLVYDEDTDTVSSELILFSIRDFFGIYEDKTVTERPASLTDVHKYNLLNQGWDMEKIQEFNTGGSSGDGDAPGTGLYPSNVDLQVYGKSAEEVFKPQLIVRNYAGNTPAPKGRMVINAFSRGASRNEQASLYNNVIEDEIFYEGGYSINIDTGYFTPDNLIFSSLPEDLENGAITTSAAYAGRVFYSGIQSDVSNGDSKSPDYTGFVFFTKLVSNVDDLGYCYQEADPTSENISDLVATDGGYIQIPEASNIFKMVATDRSLLIIAENGVWELLGDTDAGFTALGYQVNKIGSIGALSATSIVEVEGTILYWAAGGIYTLSYDQSSGYLRPQNISATTIQSHYSAIPSVGRKFAKGSFDSETRKVTWLYNDEVGYDGVTSRHNYNRELVFDTLLTAFYTNTISDISGDANSPHVAGFAVMPTFTVVDFANPVVVNGVLVQANAVDVAVTRGEFSRGSGYTKYLTILPNSSGNLLFTFSSYRSSTFADWYTYNTAGADYTSELVTGYEIVGDSSKWKQAMYVTFHFTRTEQGFIDTGGALTAINPSSCLVSAKWDFADHANSGKIGPQFQAYRLLRNYIPTGANDTFDYGQSVITTKNKIRGRGKALSIQITSEAGKDMELLGWSIPFIAGEAP